MPIALYIVFSVELRLYHYNVVVESSFRLTGWFFWILCLDIFSQAGRMLDYSWCWIYWFIYL